MTVTARTEDIFFEEDDIAYEEDILRNPHSVKAWLRYIEHKQSSPANVVNLVYERALKELPGSYKLWYRYLKLRRAQVKGRCPVLDAGHEDVNNAFERSLVFMHKMPRIWMDYCKFLIPQGKTTRIRRTFDRALRALPITQHHRIWTLYLKWVKDRKLPEVSKRVYRRYLKMMPEHTEDYIEYLLEIDELEEASQLYVKILNKEGFVSTKGKSKYELWRELCDMICKNPDKISSTIKVEPILRQGIKRYTDQVGVLWNYLAEYFLKSGFVERARDIYEEAMQTVTTVRDFTQIFDAYAQCEESVLRVKMEQAEKHGASHKDDLEMDWRIARMEHLLERRPLLLNSVLLRQNPHNVHEWHKRVELYEGKPTDIIHTYTEAVQTVDPKLASGKLHTLWVAYAKFYESANQIEDARIIFDKATKVEYKTVDELAAVWCEWAEMEIRHEYYDAALKLMQKATSPPPYQVAYHDHSETVQHRIYKSLKVWSMYADLEESFGTYQSCKTVYDRILDLKIATPQIVINYGMFLRENNYFEEAFKAYEKGISLFKWPNVYDVWITYLTNFIDRYGGKKLERCRDLFEQCLESCPPKFAKALYLLYAKLEESHGLARHAMAVYDKATRAVLPEEQYDMFNIYIQRAAEIYGVTHTRSIYEKAIEVLHEHQAREMVLRFADLERKLGEIDRARALYSYGSQLADPRVAGNYWATWKDFEIKHGNEDTVKEMLRIKRSVQATFNTQVNYMSAQMLANQAAPASSTGNAQTQESEAVDEMRKLEIKARELAEEAVNKAPSDGGAAAAGPKGGNILFVRSNATDEELGELTKTNNPEEINIDSESDEDENIEEVDIQQQAVPSEVFGKLAPKDVEDD